MCTIICATSYICDQCITYFFVAQIFMVLMYEFFFVSCPFLLLSYHRYGLHKSVLNNVIKIQKKLQFTIFSEQLRTGHRFTDFQILDLEI
jgi:hypothetical protein